MVILDPGADLEQAATETRNALQGLMGEDGKIIVTAGEAAMSQMMGTGLDVTIRGQSYENIARISAQLFSELEGIEGIDDLERKIIKSFFNSGSFP